MKLLKILVYINQWPSHWKNYDKNVKSLGNENHNTSININGTVNFCNVELQKEQEKIQGTKQFKISSRYYEKIWKIIEI